MIVQFWKRDAFSVAVELFVLLVVSHVGILRLRVHNPNLEASTARFSGTSLPIRHVAK